MNEKAVVSNFLWCPIIRILSQMILLSLQCENLLVSSNWVCKKKTVSQYDKLHSFGKSPLIISLKLFYTCRLQWLSKTATNSVKLLTTGLLLKLCKFIVLTFFRTPKSNGTNEFSHDNDSRIIWRFKHARFDTSPWKIEIVNTGF